MAKKAGKYAAVIGALPTLGIDPARRDAVTQAQEQIKASLDTDYGHSIDDPKPEDVIQCITQDFKQLIELKKRQTAGRPWASEYARAYAECRAIREKIKEWDGAFSLLVEAFMWLMIDQMKVEGVTALTLANGQPVHTFEEPQAQVDNPEAFRQWCAASIEVCMTCGEREGAPWHRTPLPDILQNDQALVDQVDFGIDLSEAGPFPTTKEVDAALTVALGGKANNIEVHSFKPGGGLERKLALPWGTTNALAKEMLLHGEAEPPGVSVWAKTTVRLGKGDE